MLSIEPQSEAFSKKQKIIFVLKYCKHFITNPIIAIRSLPNWNWLTILSLYTLYSLLCGALQGLIQGPHFLFAALLAPPLSLLATFILSSFLYFASSYFFHKSTPLLDLFICVALASTPNLFLYIFSGWIPPLSLIGMAFFFTLLCIGLVENFNFPKTITLKCFVALYILYFSLWIINSIAFSSATTL